MGWRIIQALIVLAVICANIYWQFTPNGFVATLMGVGLAMLVTGAWQTVTDWFSRREGTSQAARDR